MVNQSAIKKVAKELKGMKAEKMWNGNKLSQIPAV
jgi:hypothetical protein